MLWTLAMLAVIDGAYLRCPEPTILNMTKTWTERDAKQIQPEKLGAECKKRYPGGSECFVSLTKTAEGAYRVKCGEKRPYIKDVEAPSSLESR